MIVIPKLDVLLCDGCGLCIAACHGGGIVPAGDRVIIVETKNCDFCAVCEAVCPRGAIKCAYMVVLSED